MIGKLSKTGYRKDSPDRNNDFNVIPSTVISMTDVAFPVMGISDTGHKKLMMPGGQYKFPGKSVLEVPLKQYGGQSEPEYTPEKNFKNAYQRCSCFGVRSKGYS